MRQRQSAEADGWKQFFQERAVVMWNSLIKGIKALVWMQDHGKATHGKAGTLQKASGSGRPERDGKVLWEALCVFLLL